MSEQPQPGKYRLRYSQLEDHALALGYVCMVWAQLETAVDALLFTVTPIPGDGPSEIIAGRVDIRDKIFLLKHIGFVRKPSDAWFSRLEMRLKEIDSAIRNDRNRYIHDLWMSSADGPLKGGFKATLSKTQSWQPRELKTFYQTRVDADEIWDLVRRIVDVSGDLIMLMAEFRGAVFAPPSP